MHVIVDGSRDNDATGLGEFLQPRRDVDPVAKDVGTVDHHVSQIDADAKPHLPRVRWVRVLIGNFLLNLDRTLHGFDNAGELGDHGIAPSIHDPPVVALHQACNGAAVAAQLMVSGLGPWTSTIIAMLSGCMAGSITAFLNLKLKILHILAGILTAIALYSINLRVMGRPNIGLLRVDTVYSSIEMLGLSSFYAPLVLLAAIVVLCKLLLDLFLATGFGLSLRAAGANPRMAQANGVRVQRMIWIGLAIANGLTALSGAMFAQMLGAADVSMGIGVIVVALAAVIGGTALVPSRLVPVATLACVLGSILYGAIELFLNPENQWVMRLYAIGGLLFTVYVIVATYRCAANSRSPTLARLVRILAVISLLLLPVLAYLDLSGRLTLSSLLGGQLPE